MASSFALLRATGAAVTLRLYFNFLGVEGVVVLAVSDVRYFGFECYKVTAIKMCCLDYCLTLK